jgi:hypothetical protein
LNHEQTVIAVIDCSFLIKSGKKTEEKAEKIFFLENKN